MFDCHYDLLTYIYMNKRNLKNVIRHCNSIFTKDNITGGIFNLFYMSKDEMKNELHIFSNEINVVQNLREVEFLIRKYKIIPPNIKYIIGIEGLDYLQKIEDIDILYSLGLRSTGIVWNNKNKFGAGIRDANSYGLTPLGEQLIEKLVSKNIAIDLSHANEKTFFDIINKCKKLKSQGFNPIVFASHSNCKTYCNVPRNLNDRQLLEIKKLDGIIGVVSIKKFCSHYQDMNCETAYVNHINYLRKLFGGINNIAVASDDMSFYIIEPEKYQNMNVFKHEVIKTKIEQLLIKNNYSKTEIEQILYKNVNNKIINKL